MFWRKKKEDEKPEGVMEGKFNKAADDKIPFIPTQPIGSSPLTSDSMASIKGQKIIDFAKLGFFLEDAKPIGFQSSAILSTNWLIGKACNEPAKDAVRKGYRLGDNDKELRDYDERFNLTKHMMELIHFSRVYGGRLALFSVESENPKKWYENPFNIDGVKEGAYKGIIQIDPNWVQPEINSTNLNDPASHNFYEPNHYRIGDMLYHKSHFVICIPDPVPDYLKPSYNYMGVSIPQKILQRAYAAERSANEAPNLLMTKRLNELHVSESALSNPSRLMENIKSWLTYRDNYGVKVSAGEERVTQHDTNLSNVDEIISSQYQLVAAASSVPVTKLLGTTPKGFNSTGEHDAENYRILLEGIQKNDLTPLLMRHYQLLAKSEGLGAPKEIDWEPIDSPTAREVAEINQMQANTYNALWQTGAIDSVAIAEALSKDRDGDFFGMLNEVSFEDSDEQES